MAVWLFGAVVATSLVAGCFEGGPLGGGDNDPPEAVLGVDRTSAELGEEFTFNVTGSRDPDGELTLLRIDFGDGTVREFENEENSTLKYAYRAAGEYTVVLTVLDNGAKGEEALTDSDEMTVAVNERTPIDAQVAQAGLPVGTATRGATTPFNATDGVDAYRLNLSANSLLAAGSSEVRIRIVGPDGSDVANHSVTVPAGQTVPVRLEGDLDDVGNYSVVISATSGAARLAGDLFVQYDEGMEASDESPSPSPPVTPAPKA